MRTDFYVYAHYHIDSTFPFYVGKGFGHRANQVIRKGWKHSEETKAKISAINKGRKNPAVAEANRKRKHGNNSGLFP